MVALVLSALRYGESVLRDCERAWAQVSAELDARARAPGVDSFEYINASCALVRRFSEADAAREHARSRMESALSFHQSLLEHGAVRGGL